jgi:hypothetical protein
LFTTPPQQSDYAAEWSTVPLKGANENRLAFFDREMASRDAEESHLSKRLIARAPRAIRLPLRWLRQGRKLEEAPDPRQMEQFLAKGGSKLS